MAGQFGGKKAAPFVKGGGRKKSHPRDAKGRLRAKAALKRAKGADLSNEVDLSGATSLLSSGSAKARQSNWAAWDAAHPWPGHAASKEQKAKTIIRDQHANVVARSRLGDLKSSRERKIVERMLRRFPGLAHDPEVQAHAKGVGAKGFSDAKAVDSIKANRARKDLKAALRASRAKAAGAPLPLSSFGAMGRR